MKKILFFIIFVLVGGLLSGQLAHAAAVYLKNGTVMKGRIVARDQEKIVLKTGEGEAEAKVTIFLDDILRIESEEEYAAEVALIPFGLYQDNAGSKKPWDDLAPFLGPGADKSGMEYIRELLAQDRRLSASKVDTDNDKEKGVYQEDKEEYGVRTEVFSPAQSRTKKGDGSVSGIVKLPKIPKGEKGNVYVYLMEKLQEGVFSAGSEMLFQKIDASKVVTDTIFYKIEHVPAGTYKVHAQWDVAYPPIQERRVRDGFTLDYLGFKGDYRGSTPETISLSEDENKWGVNFSCKSPIESGVTLLIPEEKPLFEIMDLVYREVPPEPPKFILIVKNKSRSPIYHLLVDILVNEKKVTQMPMELGFFEGNKEREFDITEAYNVYKELIGRENPDAVVGKAVTFKILWPTTEEVLFEKALFIL